MFACAATYRNLQSLNASMLLRNLIKDTIPPLLATDTVSKALSWMKEFRQSNLPVISDNGYLGMVYENDLLKVENQDQPLMNQSVPFNRLFVNEYQHIFDAIRFAANNAFTIVPVLNDREQYMGIVTVMDIIQALAEANSVQVPGGVIVLEMDRNRYALSEIARIVESENAQVLSASAIVTPNPDKVEVTLKVNRVDLTRVLAGFFRHNYDVKASYHQSEFQQDVQSRYEAFMNYLKM